MRNGDEMMRTAMVTQTPRHERLRSEQTLKSINATDQSEGRGDHHRRRPKGGTVKPLARTSPVEGVRLGTAADELFAGPDVWKLVPDPGSEFMSVRWRRETPCTDIDVVDGIVCVVTFWEHCRLSGRELIGATFAELRSALGQPWIVDSVEPLVLELGDWCDVWIEDGVVRRVTFADYGSISD